jgi:transposase-like protein
VTLSYTFVKLALQEAGLIPTGRARGRHRRRREPRACFGELLHLDGSDHAWLALCPGQRQTLISVLDDATKRLRYAQLSPEETTHAVLTALRAVLARCGLPMALYTDRAGWAFHTPTAGGPVDRTRLTAVGRILARLGIEHIPSYSPQARGRVERLNRTLQGRLIIERCLARTGRTPEELGRQFEPSAQTIRNWLRQADRDDGRRTDGLTTEEREEVRRLRREVKRRHLRTRSSRCHSNSPDQCRGTVGHGFGALAIVAPSEDGDRRHAGRHRRARQAAPGDLPV